MAEFTAQLNELQRLLVNEDQFKTTMAYFFDHLGCNQAFVEASKKTKNPKVKGLFEQVGKSLFGEETRATNLVLLQIPRARFFHGGCFLAGHHSCGFYFDGLDIGMMAINMDFATSLMNFARFSSTRVDPGNIAAFTGTRSATLQ